MISDSVKMMISALWIKSTNDTLKSAGSNQWLPATDEEPFLSSSYTKEYLKWWIISCYYYGQNSNRIQGEWGWTGKISNVLNSDLMAQVEDLLCRFDSSVHNTKAVEVLDSHDCFCHIQSGHFQWKTLQDIKHVTTSLNLRGQREPRDIHIQVVADRGQ